MLLQPNKLFNYFLSFLIKNVSFLKITYILSDVFRTAIFFGAF